MVLMYSCARFLYIQLLKRSEKRVEAQRGLAEAQEKGLFVKTWGALSVLEAMSKNSSHITRE